VEVKTDELNLFLEPLCNKLELFITNDIDSILYQKAIEYCQDIGRQKGLQCNIEKIDKNVFFRKMSEGDRRKRLRYLYFTNNQDLCYELIGLVMINKNKIFFRPQPLLSEISSENNRSNLKEKNEENSVIINIKDIHGNIQVQSNIGGTAVMKGKEDNRSIENLYEQTENFGIGQMSGGEIKDNAKIGGIINESPQKSLAEVAKEIQELLEQLSQTNPTTKTTEKMEVVGKAINIVEENPSLKSKIIKVLKAVGKESFKEAVDHPLANIFIAGVEAWTE
jgi:hypothetical protein